MIEQIPIAAAVVLVAVMAWDIARRHINARTETVIATDDVRVEQLERNHEQLAADLVKTDKVMKELAVDWRAKFEQLEGSLGKTGKELESKVVATLATQLPSKGYNR